MHSSASPLVAMKRLVTNIRVKTLVVLSSALFLVVGHASAQTQALTFTGGSRQFFPGYTVGWTFLVDRNLSVSSLGWFDDGSDGLLNDHEVGIFTILALGNGSLLTSATVTTADTLLNGYRYHSIAPLILTPGSYLIGGTTGNDLFQSLASGVTTASGITFGAGRFTFTNDSALTYPTTTSNQGIAYFGPNFTVSGASAAPEPSTLGLLMGGVGTMAGIALRRRGVRK